MPGRSASFSPTSSSASDRGDDDGVKSRKPDNTAFKQQRLPAWQPILTAQSVLPAFFVISIIFIPVGVVLLLASNEIVEVSYDYTNCDSIDTNEKCSDVRSNITRMAEQCRCNITIVVDKNMSDEVFVYYGLTNFFQNHRRYVKSRDDNQLNGQTVDRDSISGECTPYRLVNDSIPIAPCGAIANSLFNDSFTIENGPGGSVSIDLTGIAWPTDKNQKFNNPSPSDNLTIAFSGFAQPFYWQKPVFELDVNDPTNNGYENEGLIVWMRTAAFPTFRKPYGRIPTGLPEGSYTIVLDYNFPVAAFDGTKRLILSTTSWIGGKNSFLGIAYIVVGSLCFAIGVALCIVHQVTKKKGSTAPRRE